MSDIERVPIEYAQPPHDMPEGWRVPSVGTIESFQRSAGLGVVPTHHPALHRVAIEIPADAVQSEATRRLVDKMRRVIDGETAAGNPILGLAAPQIGESFRAFLVNRTIDGGPDDFDPTALTVMINPRLTVAANSRTRRIPEQCFSCGPLAALVERPVDIWAEWTDEHGIWQEAVLEPNRAIVAGHENDHLDGRLFPDRALEQGEELAWVDAEQTAAHEYVRAVHAGDPWGQRCHISQWKAMKRPQTATRLAFRLADFVIAS